MNDRVHLQNSDDDDCNKVNIEIENIPSAQSQEHDMISSLSQTNSNDENESVFLETDDVADTEEEDLQQPDLQPIDITQFEEIFTRFQTPICNFLYRLVGNREQAYDLAQDVFVKAYKALTNGAIIQPKALSSWIYRIASNTATDSIRRRKLITWLPLSMFGDDRGIGAGLPTQADDATETAKPAVSSAFGQYDGGRFEQHIADQDLIQSVLEMMPEKYTICLLLYENEGFSCNEIAEMLEISASAVKMRLMRAREKFIALYKQESAKS